jgi:bacillolysin
MADGFERFHYHVADAGEDSRDQPAFLGLRAIPPDDVDVNAGFNSDEAAARFHLSKLLEQSDQPALSDVVAPERPELVPDLRFVDIHDVAPTATRLVRFEQTHATIPVFGSRVVCELNEQRGLVSADAQVAQVQGVSPVASLSPADALASIASFVGVEPSSLGEVQPPALQFFHTGGGPWHLVYYVQNVPAAPRALTEGALTHGPGDAPPSSLEWLVNYLVDAHSGEVVDYFSATPTLDVPVKCSGVDEHGKTVQFFGRRSGSGFELRDPLRDVITYDLKLADLATNPPPPLPAAPVQNTTTEWAATNKAAVSAHANASAVCNFYNGVLFRDGIDDKGMDLLSVVNCSNSGPPAHEAPPIWHNARWSKSEHRMEYGQTPDPSDPSGGTLISYSRFLDVIAHELTHGVTQTSSGLVYQGQSGALNESFSDIFGILVKNWNHGREDGGDVTTWDWEMGSGLGANGLPLRDLSDPTRTRCARTPNGRCPAHMRDYLVTAEDAGGVHTNSNIHNKAAHNLLTAVDAGGSRVFTPREVAYLYYYCLLRLSSQAMFLDALIGLIGVSSTLFAGDLELRQSKIDVIRRSYSAVGITEPS